MKKLKPCPFCKEDKELYTACHEDSTYYAVQCGDCGAWGPSFDAYRMVGWGKEEAEALAIKAWNAREK